MSCRRSWAVVVTALVLCPVSADAQSDQAPGYRERELAQIIREAGYDLLASREDRCRIQPSARMGSHAPRSSNL